MERWGWRALAALCVAASSGGCGVQYHYRVTEEAAPGVAAVQAAQRVQWRPLKVSFVPDWEVDEAAWERHVANWQGYFANYLPYLSERREMSVSWVAVPPGGEATDGVLLEVDLHDLLKGESIQAVGDSDPAWGYWTATFVDAGTGEVLYRAEMETDSFLGVNPWDFDSRIRNVVYHLSHAALDVLQKGQLGIGPRTQVGQRAW